MDKLITSSGIIVGRQAPRVGIIGANDNLAEFIWDEIHQGIDITYQEYIEDLKKEGKSDDEIEKLCEYYESDNATTLFGDAWELVGGKYCINRSKSLAAIYNSGTNTISVEFSKWTKWTHHTSPCFVMNDGSGPCGDLSTPGNSVLAYDLPPDFYAAQLPLQNTDEFEVNYER